MRFDVLLIALVLQPLTKCMALQNTPRVIGFGRIDPVLVEARRCSGALCAKRIEQRLRGHYPLRQIYSPPTSSITRQQQIAIQIVGVMLVIFSLLAIAA